MQGYFSRPSRRGCRQRGKSSTPVSRRSAQSTPHRCLRRSHNIRRDQHHLTQAHHLFHLLPSGRRYRLICAGNGQTGPQPLPPGSESAERTLLVLGYASMKRLEKISRRHMNSLLCGNDKKVFNLESSDICHYLYPAFLLLAPTSGECWSHDCLSTVKSVKCVHAPQTPFLCSRFRSTVSLRQLVFTAVK